MATEQFRKSPIGGVDVGGKRSQSRFETSLLDGAVELRETALKLGQRCDAL